MKNEEERANCPRNIAKYRLTENQALLQNKAYVVKTERRKRSRRLSDSLYQKHASLSFKKRAKRIICMYVYHMKCVPLGISSCLIQKKSHLRPLHLSYCASLIWCVSQCCYEAISNSISASHTLYLIYKVPITCSEIYVQCVLQSYSVIRE